VPFEEQQFHAVMIDRVGYLDLSYNEQARSAERIAQALHGGPGEADGDALAVPSG
jgi:hypothetical protein